MTSDFQEIHLKSIVHLNSLGGIYGVSHRAMFKLGGKKIFVLCLLVKNVSAVYSADRCSFKKSEKAPRDVNRIGGDISSDEAHNSEHIGHFRFPIPVANWQFLIKV